MITLLNNISSELSRYKGIREALGDVTTTQMDEQTDARTNMVALLKRFCDLLQKPQGWTDQYAQGIGRAPAPGSFYIAILPPGQSASNGIYTAICFDAEGMAITIGCCRGSTKHTNIDKAIIERLGLTLGLTEDKRTEIKDAFRKNFFNETAQVFRRGDNGWTQDDCDRIANRIQMANDKCLEIINQMENGGATNMNHFSDIKKKIRDKIRDLLVSNFNVILTGAPGTGKTYTAREVAKEMVGAAVAATATADDKENAKKIEEERIASVQFHPGYDYSDFVIGMKPVLICEENGKEVFRDKNGLYTKKDEKKEEESDDNKERLLAGWKTKVSFQWKDGIFKKFADKAKVHPEYKYVFLIDEINRADLSRVFGELFSLLEEEYRYCKEDGVEKNAKGVTLPDGTNFVIPKNLYIIGTMNDIDRSVESMDFALRRRFAWKEVTADESKYILYAAGKGGFRKVTDIDAKKLECAMDELNKVIGGSEKLKVSDENYNQQDCELRLGSEYQLGAAIFAKLEKYVGRDTNGNPEKATSAAFNSLWNNHIKNILSEYLRGRPGRDKMLLPALREIFNAAVNDASKKEEEPKAEENVHESNAPDAVNLQQN